MNNYGKLFAVQKVFIKFKKAWLLAGASNQLTLIIHYSRRALQGHYSSSLFTKKCRLTDL